MLRHKGFRYQVIDILESRPESETQVDAPVLPPAEMYINRELSLLEFNQRVL